MAKLMTSNKLPIALLKPPPSLCRLLLSALGIRTSRLLKSSTLINNSSSPRLAKSVIAISLTLFTSIDSAMKKATFHLHDKLLHKFPPSLSTTWPEKTSNPIDKKSPSRLPNKTLSHKKSRKAKTSPIKTNQSLFCRSSWSTKRKKWKKTWSVWGSMLKTLSSKTWTSLWTTSATLLKSIHFTKRWWRRSQA